MSTLEWNTAYDVDTLTVTDDYVPGVQNSGTSDVWVESESWGVIKGKTGQHGYRGAVMHPSESADDSTIAGWVREVGGSVFALVEVQEEGGGYPDGDPIGWAIVYR